jgi:hypothetical protein
MGHVKLTCELPQPFRHHFINLCDSRTSWSFPLLAALREDKYTKFRYTPMSDFRLEIRKFPHFILEVVSTPNQADRWRMLLQASCLARLGNKLRKSSVNEPVIIMATYIDLQMTAHEYLVYQPDMSHKKVGSQLDVILNGLTKCHGSRSYIMKPISTSLSREQHSNFFFGYTTFLPEQRSRMTNS